MKRSPLVAVFCALLLLLATPKSSAQSEVDDAYDPFADYSEFDEASDEEADINFFRHGRFFSLGMAGGLRTFTGQMRNFYSSSLSYGLFMTYFFDLRLAIQIGFLTGDHALKISHPAETVEGTVSFTFFNIDLKYYMSSQNVSRGLADLNPYVFGGLNQVYRTISVPGDAGTGRDNTMGFSLGGGVEIPIVRKKSYLGFQGAYRMFTFPDENTNIVLPDTQVETGFKQQGDSIDFMTILGISF